MHHRPFLRVPSILLIQCLPFIQWANAQNLTAPTSPVSPNQFAAPSSVTITACGPATMDDYGYLQLSPAILSAQSSLSGNGQTDIQWRVLNSPNILGLPSTFSQAQVNAGSISITPELSLLSVINSNTQTNVSLIASDERNNVAACGLIITIQYNFSPYPNPTSSYSISTTPNQPVIISTSIFQLLENHGLSLWNLNLTIIAGTQFSLGGYGSLEFFSMSCKCWLPIPATQFIPYEWIDMKSVRYNPIGWIGQSSIVLQVVTSHNFRITPWRWKPSANLPTLNATIALSSGWPIVNGTVQVPFNPQQLPTPSPPDANLPCKQYYPSKFDLSEQSPFGPYCTNFTTSAGVSSTVTVTDFLGASISLTTDVAATVYFGTSIIPSTDYMPPNTTTVKFVGYLDYGAWYLLLSPATANILSAGITFITPEVYYDEIVGGLTSSQIMGVQFDPVAKTSSQFFVSSVADSGPPQITMSLNSPGLFFLTTLTGPKAGAGVGIKVNVPWGPMTYNAEWVSRTFTYPPANHGTLTATITSNLDLIVNFLPTCATTWIPGGYGKFDCFTIGVSSTSAQSMTVNVTLMYTWATPMVADYNTVDPNLVRWGHFSPSLDGGIWNFTIPTTLDVGNGVVTTSLGKNDFGQWSVLGAPNGDLRTRPSWMVVGVLVVFSGLLCH